MRFHQGLITAATIACMIAASRGVSHLTSAAMALRGRRATTSWLSALRVMMLVGVTTSRRDTVLAPAGE
jgi:hypothetical protein